MILVVGAGSIGRRHAANLERLGQRVELVPWRAFDRAAVERAVARGVRVRILTNSLASNDVGIVHSGYAKYRKPLLEGEVEVYEFKPDARTAEKGAFSKLTMGSSGATSSRRRKTSMASWKRPERPSMTPMAS